MLEGYSASPKRRLRMASKHKIGEEDKMELYRAFFQKMLDEGYCPEYIGIELAVVAHALYTSTDQ